MAIVVVSVGKADLRPVDLSLSPRYQNILEIYFPPTSLFNALMQYVSTFF